MSLILANINELVVGKPLPWSLYDQEHNLLLGQGGIVRDDEHRDALLANGACHELLWEAPNKKDGEDNLFAAEEVSPKQSGNNKTDKNYTFDDMKLKVGDRLQLEPPAQLTSERFLVKLIGFLKGSSLLVTPPATDNGLRLQFLEKETVVMRYFSGQNAFGFVCTILRTIKVPYEYIHLSFPSKVQGIVIRKAPRVRVRIIAAVKDSKTGTVEQTSALISDISANGASVDAKQPLGGKGDILDLAFRVQLHNIDAYLSIKGLVHTVLNVDSAEASKSGIIRHGIEFKELQPNDSVILQSMIYQQMIENPHKLV